jgi:predicted nuclease of predicted toxin-antitoxin system
MRFKVDENMPVEVAALLRSHGHDAETVLDEDLGGQPDPVIAAVCQSENRVLLTLDLDFADIRTYPPAESTGKIVFRLRATDKPHVLNVLQRVIASLPQHSPNGQLWIVDDAAVRIRT